MILHAGLMALQVAGAWRGMLITGPSGSGKSELAWRLIEQGFSLVADDRVMVWTSGGRLYGRAPETLFGLIEARGVGVRRQPARPFVTVDLVCACTPAAEIERMPDEAFETVLGLTIFRLSVDPYAGSSPAKLRHLLSGLG